MHIGTQYYRPPFPNQKYWKDDFARIRDSGLDTVQLWVLWGWVEPKPGEFIFDDYDALVDLAAQNGLGVVLSAIAEIQPYWIHREVPGSELVSNYGHKIISSNRNECHFGLTPGGCFDNPGVWERMSGFFTQVATRYAPASHLRGWDCWNELRWNVNAQALACFCPETIREFRSWLDAKYGGLDGLNQAWQRRYRVWEDVLPGKIPGQPYTEMMAFEHFLTVRANRHAKARYDIIKAIDPLRPVTVHGSCPTPLYDYGQHDHALNKGNDWAFADALDGVGSSSFPKWTHLDDADFSMRVECVKSAARGKKVWLSEVQGGRASLGSSVTPAVDAVSQQRWIWNGLACGADMILFWCWRDEVFCSEAGGFGLIGGDGLAEERLEAMRATGRVLREHRSRFEAYQPVTPEVGMLFSPQSYYQDWAQNGNADATTSAFIGVARALVRNNIPYVVVEEEHLEALEGLKVLFLPRTNVMDDAVAEKLSAFVRGGGTLVCESECGAFDSVGIWRYPEDRFTSKLSGLREVGRRELDGDQIAMTIDGEALDLNVKQWLTPWMRGDAQILADHPDGALVSVAPVDHGRLVLCGTYLAEAYRRAPNVGYERFVAWAVASSGWTPDIVVEPADGSDAVFFVKQGTSGGKRMVFVFFPEDCDDVRLCFRQGFIEPSTMRELISDVEVPVVREGDGTTCVVHAPEWRFAVLAAQ
ncbi:MAG: beta-galactosidase [Kiritimatiellia bacterium]|jgi:beta-galactosidase